MVLISLAKVYIGRYSRFIARLTRAWYGPRGIFRAAILGAFSLCWPTTGQDDKVDFNFQIRPILSDRCFKCHGPDEKTRKAKLRLDLAENALAIRDEATGKRAIDPGHPERSELIRRITAADPADLMPPAKSNLSLTDQERALLRQWIAQGAEYKPHWAFIAVKPQAVPKPVREGQARNPIDNFVLAYLERKGMSLSPEASREQLIRRLSFDLTGLPPSLRQIDEFLADTSSTAYEKLVDRLLAAPAYGERRANEWLDLARYADTYGYQNDVECDLSPWRDWVIRAFNENLPYDQFILWQLAGDLLPNPTRDQVLATAFNRLHRQTNEGGSVEEEFRTEYVSDRVQTAATTFLGLTMECARCHDHKFDPIKQKDFYRMSAFFNNIDESGLYSHFTMAIPTPTLLLYPDGIEARHERLQSAIKAKEAELSILAAKERDRFNNWLHSGTNLMVIPMPAAAYHFEELNNNQTPNSVRTNQSAVLVDNPQPIEGKIGQALQFSGDNSVICRGAGAYNRTAPFSISLWLRPTARQERAVILHRSRAWTDSGSRGYELVLEEGRPAFSLIHFWPGNALRVRAIIVLRTNEWSHLTVTYDGSSRAKGVSLYLDGDRLALEVIRDNLFKDIQHRNEWNDMEAGAIELTLAGRFRDSGFKDGALDELEVFDQCLTPLEVRLLKDRNDVNPTPEAAFDYYLHRVNPAYQAVLNELRQLREQENKLIDEVKEIMVMKEMPVKRPTFVLRRGTYDSPGEPVEPGTPDAIFPFSKELPHNRLGLAYWMLDRNNPLTVRVAVNRVWRTHFGRGLVATAENFGSQGQLPTHPELLDWLAGKFIDSGWNLKALHKMIVMSAAYRQTSKASPELPARDLDNQLLARGPRHRLDAEEICDNALAISGLLVPQIGGPSVRPYQPEGLWEQAGTGKHYRQDHGQNLYRRSLYTFWKRTLPPPNMLTFDAITREVCTARRETTTTPLQALVLLDDPQYVEAARVLAERLVRGSTTNVDDRIIVAFRLATGRLPETTEMEILRRLYQEQLALFRKHPESAEQYLKIGEYPLDKDLPSDQVAATMVLASMVMNLDEFVNER